MTDKDISDRVRNIRGETLCDDHFVLRKWHFDYRRGDGRWQTLARRSFDLEGAIGVLPWDRARDMVLLVRQFRWSVYEDGVHELMIEAIAGKLDGDSAETCAHREALEEAGVTLSQLSLVTNCFSSPGAVKERVACFLADYDSTAPRAPGGGLEEEGEDIEVLEMPLDQAFAMIAGGEINDAKTILLLQAAKLRTLP